MISDINIEFRFFFSLDDVLYNVGHVQRVCTDKYKHKILRTRHCSSVWILRVFLGRWGFHRGTHKLFCKFLNFEWAATKKKCWEHATKYLKVLSWCTLIICFFIDSLLDSLGITSYYFFYLIGMPWGKRPLPQKLLLPDEEIPLRLLEYSRFVIICFANISSLRTSFFHRRDVHNLKTHVRSLSACDVHEILGSVSNSQKTGTNAYHDQRNGILKEKCCF